VSARSWRRPILLGAAACALGAFWATAKAVDWFSDAPYLMLPPHAPSTFESSRFITPHETALALVAALYVLPAAWLVAVAMRGSRGPMERLATALKGDDRTIPVLTAVLAIAGAAFVSYALIDKTELLDDERSYLFQAKLFTTGKISLPGLPAAFRNPMFIVHPVFASKYFPGNAAALALGVLVGAPHVIHPLLAGATTLAVYSFVNDAFGKRQAMLAAVLFAISPFVVCMDGTVMPFGLAAAGAAAMLAGISRATKTSRALPGLLGGLALGVLFVTRPFDAVVLGAPAGGWLVYAAWRGRLPWAVVGSFALGFAALAWIVPWYDHALTGSAWKTGYALEGNPIRLGFQRSFVGPYRHTPVQAGAVEASLLLRLDSWLWALPGGLVLVLVGVVRSDAAPLDALLRASVASFLLGFVLVPAPGTWDVGPTYAFFVVPVLVALATRGVHRIWTLCEDRPRRAQLEWALTAFLALGLVTTTPLRLARIANLAAAIRAPWDFVAASRAGGAVIVVPPTGGRGAPGWGYGYPYEIKTADGKTSKLIRPLGRAEYDEAMAYLGAHDSLALEMNDRLLTVTKERGFLLVPFDPEKRWGP
jgi:hypothetical protein